jgi:putative restriction endonuclease
VTNGILLQPTFHRAFDTSLIYLDLDFAMKLNPACKEELEDEDMDDGIDEIERRIGKRLVFLPRNRAEWPDEIMIENGKIKRSIK